MTLREIDIRTLCAVLLTLAGVALTPLLLDDTPLLVEPAPDLDWPMGLAGLGMGLWSARRFTRLMRTPKAKAGRWAVWLLLPTMLWLGLVALGDRVQEAISFGGATARRTVTVPVPEKTRNTGRRGRVTYEVGVANPFGGRAVTLRVDEATFERVAVRSCVTILIERAPNGATRLLAPQRWNASCVRPPVAVAR